ncbi:methylated-DNA--[protein]-cysteine S-methyltransferase [Nocardia pseudovaccinii]|uniref:methylated-DNA--[protein]-cysteine S-methyltransferase n=1 Tax=Nocardia pseudovaccinii TaxID=189540 RepID=UPI0007A3F10C|nr:methylated-DNA--[protein]-cysteine S-methyltransferase [Nocardia pseudovaccinii]
MISDTAIARLVNGSTLGNLLIEANQTGITLVAFTDELPTESTGENSTAREHLETAADQIDEYLTGERQQFTVSMDLTDMSAFDREVLRTLEATTGYGRTTTYGALTRQLGRTPADARKIGGALARNRLLILLPCHRVLGADGSLTGYAGGLPAKRALLDLESADLLLPLGG